MSNIVALDTRELSVTPIFGLRNIENIPKSEAAGYPVMEMREVVQVRFAGSDKYSPVFPINEFWKREGNRTITYAERWAEQYRHYKEGNPQEALGTPLEMLRLYGITPEQISICRAHRIYSIEALHHLEGQAVKSLGMAANTLKDYARRWMAENRTSSETQAELDALRAKIAALESELGLSTTFTEEDPINSDPTDADRTLARVESDEAMKAGVDSNGDLTLEGMTEKELRDMIELETGVKPDGRLGKPALLNMAKSL